MASANEEHKPNTRVRLIGDPTQCGIITGRTRPGRRGKILRYQVIFPNECCWIPADQIDEIPAAPESPVDLLQAGKLGRVIDLRRTLTHVRLTGRLADVIYSMEATNTDYYPYQFKPVLRFLMSPSNALLIADEVGLGKTIEAGLIWTELRSRFDLRRLVVLCPAILREKWERELRQKMGVKANIVGARGLFETLRDPNASLQGFATIGSLQGMRPHRDWEDTDTPNAAANLARFLQSKENETPLIDLLIIDEAHYLRNPKSQTNELGRLLRPVCDNLLLLSATPIHNYNQDLFSLLQLLDKDTFERIEDLGQILEASRPLVNARDHILSPNPDSKQIVEFLDLALEHPLLRGSRQLQLARSHATNPARLQDRDQRAQLARRLETVNPLAYVITRTRKRDVKEWRVIREPVREQVPMHPSEREFYDTVTAWVINYAMSRDVNERFILATPQRQMSSSMAATLRAWQRQSDNIDDGALSPDEESNENHKIGPLKREILEKSQDFGDVDELIANDSKYDRVRKMLTHYFQQCPNEKIVLFSTFRETLNYLAERLAEDGIVSVVMHGGISESKDDVLAKFKDDPDVQLLLSSEVGSEGIDLQFCRVVVNYDLPWNPMKVEQRIGRLDRLGQEAKIILIWNLFYEGTIDSRIYIRLYEKLDLCRQALGDFEAVLGEEIGRLTKDLLSDHLTPKQQESRIDQTTQALANLEQEQHHLEREASHLVAYGDYILNEVQAAKELNRWIRGVDLQTYVTDFFGLHYSGCVFRQVEQGSPVFSVELSNAAKQDVEQFIRSERLTPTKMTQNLSHPVKCRFENCTTAGNDHVIEIVSQFHPIVRFVSKSINDLEEQLRPAVGVRLCVNDCDEVGDRGIYILAIARWSVDGLQASERLAFAATTIDNQTNVLSAADAERLVSICSHHGADWFEAKTTVDLKKAVSIADDELFGRLEEDFAEFVEDVRRQNNDRADLQMRNLERHLLKQRNKLAGVRDGHRFKGRESLVKATEGRIHALENRTDQGKRKIESRREVRYRNDEVLVVLLCIE